MLALCRVGIALKRIWGVKCSGCKQRMFSFSVHDYKTCKCPTSTSIDGGRNYLRYGWMPEYEPPKRIYWSVKLDGKYPQRMQKNRWPY